MEKVQMLFTLGHNAIISGNREQHEIDAMSARQHIPNKPLMARNIHDADAFTVRQIKVSKSQIYGNAAFLLFLQPISVLTSERFDKRCFPVIDMSSGADDVRHGSRLSRKDATFWQKGEGKEIP
jgi:hypothetical protein